MNFKIITEIDSLRFKDLSIGTIFFAERQPFIKIDNMDITKTDTTAINLITQKKVWVGDEVKVKALKRNYCANIGYDDIIKTKKEYLEQEKDNEESDI